MAIHFVKNVFKYLEKKSVCPISNKNILKKDFIQSFLINSLLEKFNFSCEFCNNKIISYTEKKR